MLEDFRLRIFMTVAETGNFTKTAELLKISQPAVSQNVAELENMLGVRLFERGRHSVTLTEEGRLFMSYSERILYWYQAADSMFGRIVTRQRKTVKIAADKDFLATALPAVVSSFRTVNPDLTFELVDTEDEASASTADLQIFISPHTDELEWKDSGETIGTFSGCAAVASASSLSMQRISSLSDLENPQIAYWTGAGKMEEVLPLELHPCVKMLSSSVDALKSLLLDSSTLIAVLPYFSIADEVEHGRITILPLASPLYAMTARLLPSEEFGRTPLYRLLRSRIQELF